AALDPQGVQGRAQVARVAHPPLARNGRPNSALNLPSKVSDEQRARANPRISVEDSASIEVGRRAGPADVRKTSVEVPLAFGGVTEAPPGLRAALGSGIELVAFHRAPP